MTTDTCAVTECERPVHARGWCWMHYYRWYRHGVTDSTVRYPDNPFGTTVAEFRAYVNNRVLVDDLLNARDAARAAHDAFAYPHLFTPESAAA